MAIDVNLRYKIKYILKFLIVYIIFNFLLWFLILIVYTLYMYMWSHTNMENILKTSILVKVCITTLIKNKPEKKMEYYFIHNNNW